MIKKPVLRKFLRQYILPEFDNFFMHQDEYILRLSSIFVHGVYFQRSKIEGVIYVHPFINFLTDGADFIGFVLGGRVENAGIPNRRTDIFEIGPTEEASKLIIKSIRAE